MSDAAHPAGQRAAAEYLRSLLLRQGLYRQAWEQHVVRPREGVVNQLAVAEVLADHQRSARVGSPDANDLPYQLRQMVADVLSGRLVSRSALSQFIAAFGFTEDEVQRLWRLWNGSATSSVLAGSHAVPHQAEQQVVDAVGPKRHQTLSLHCHIWVGSDRRIDRVRVLQVIEATAQNVDRIPLISDTNVVSVAVGQGCKELASPLRQVRPDLFTTDILLARTLGLGETMTLEYWVTYRYPGDMADPAEREQRHGVVRRLENFDMRVQFHPDQLPSKVWWARWDGIEGDVAEQEEAPLDSQHAAHRYMRSVSKTVVGFRWEWDDQRVEGLR
jgi:hypothetical protein